MAQRSGFIPLTLGPLIHNHPTCSHLALNHLAVNPLAVSPLAVSPLAVSPLVVSPLAPERLPHLTRLLRPSHSLPSKR